VKTKQLLVKLLSLGALLLAAGCSGAVGGGSSYILECNIDAESYGFSIDGEEGPVSTQTHGESTKSFYDPDGNMTTVSVEINRTMTFDESGNAYDLVGSISVDFRTDTVKYDITASGDPFEEPQTCKK
jgi:hypothetical protein